MNFAWHPTRALCAASIDPRMFIVDGVSGAQLASIRLPTFALALAYSPTSLGARLVVSLCDGSLHDVDADNTSNAVLRALHPPTVNVKKRGGSGGGDGGGGPPNRRGLLAFSGSPSTPWVRRAVPKKHLHSFYSSHKSKVQVKGGVH